MMHTKMNYLIISNLVSWMIYSIQDTTDYHLSMHTEFKSRSNHHVSETSQKSEGDVRENRLPSRAFIPLYIGI